jgi:hypothetical protein
MKVPKGTKMIKLSRANSRASLEKILSLSDAVKALKSDSIQNVLHFL